MDTKEFLKAMCQETGVSGHESRVSGIIAEEFAKLFDSVESDILGNVIGLKQGEGEGRRPRIMLAGHMDEIGLMVTKIEERGFLRFTSIGGVDQRTLVAQEVVVHGKKDVPGIIGAKPPHLIKPEERRKALPMSDMVIDVGLSEEQVRELISVGDAITLKREFIELQGDRVAAKALDDRAGVAVITECMKELQKLHHYADVLGVATVQEEVGVKGATVSAYGLEPDIGIAIDVCHAAMPGVPDTLTSPMGEGPAIALGANIHEKVFERLTQIAKEYGIKYHLEPAPGPTGTDAWAIQIARSGIASAVISIPQRYMHTSVETLSLHDIKQAGKLLAHFIASVDAEFVEGLICY